MRNRTWFARVQDGLQVPPREIPVKVLKAGSLPAGDLEVTLVPALVGEEQHHHGVTNPYFAGLLVYQDTLFCARSDVLGTNWAGSQILIHPVDLSNPLEVATVTAIMGVPPRATFVPEHAVV